jgi:tRNA(Ile)-lysidine synthase
LNHLLRGADSHDDAAWVRELANSAGLPAEIGTVPAGTLSPETGGLEENARKLRYQFLDDTAAKFDCRTIALAHTAEDQAETVLHHLLRGTGMAGLSGIPAVRDSVAGRRLVRPMLAVRRSSLEAYLRQCGQTYRTDSTNVDTAITRNRIRHVVLPLLREHINPQVDAALCRLAEQAREIDEVLSHAGEQLLQRSLMDARQGDCRLDIGCLADQPRHLVREMFRALWRRQQWPRQAMGFEQWDRLAEVLATRETITLPNRIEARFHSADLLVVRQL